MEEAGEQKNSRYLVAAGASAGGPKALLTVLKNLPVSTCGILIVQHLSRGFSEKFAGYLDPLCEMHVKEARTGDVVKDGTIYIAPDDYQLAVRDTGGGYILQCIPGSRANGFCPSINFMMKSVAETAGDRAMGIILTGMGDDGTEGLQAMKQAGAYTVTQNKETSDVYSMPGTAFLSGGARKEVALNRMADEINSFCLIMNKKIGGRV